MQDEIVCLMWSHSTRVLWVLLAQNCSLQGVTMHANTICMHVVVTLTEVYALPSYSLQFDQNICYA